MTRRGFAKSVAAVTVGATLSLNHHPKRGIHMIRFLGSVTKAAAWMEMHHGHEEVFMIGGQSVFPEYNSAGNILACGISFILPPDWRNRIAELGMAGGPFPTEPNETVTLI